MSEGPFWIPVEGRGRLATMARPLGAENLFLATQSLRAQGVTFLVSLLEVRETVDLELQLEAEACHLERIRFAELPIPDKRTPPDADAFWAFARGIEGYVAAGESVVIHCWAGIGRSSLLAAAVLVLHGIDPAEALATVSRARGLTVPETPEQREWFVRSARTDGISRRTRRAELPPVILVGGAPLSGKSTAAAWLGRRLRWPVISTDDLGAAARAVAPRDAAPDLHAHVAADQGAYHVATSIPDQLDHAIAAHAALWPAIEAVARMHATWATPAIIEGWALLPELVAREHASCAVWLVVPEQVLMERARADRDFLARDGAPEVLARRFAERSVAFSKYLTSSAAAGRHRILELHGTEAPADVGEAILATVRTHG